MFDKTPSVRPHRMHAGERRWLHAAIAVLREDAAAARPTPLVRFPLPAAWGSELLLKDESRHPTGSLKHRLARSLFLAALLDGRVREGDTVVESSSGSTAVSEAYFARMLGLAFVAIVPASTSPDKLRLIQDNGGSYELVDEGDDVSAYALATAARRGWYYMDQFENAAITTDWRSGNVASELFEQLRGTPDPEPRWIVVGAGTGGTSTTIARYCRFQQVGTRICVVDPEGSAFYSGWRDGDPDASAPGSRIEGIGRPRVEASFLPDLVDEMMPVPDTASIAGMHLLRSVLGIEAGPSTGTNLVGALETLRRMHAAGERGTVVSLICDRGDRYRHTYGSAEWLRNEGMDPGEHRAALDLLLTGPSGNTVLSSGAEGRPIT